MNKYIKFKGKEVAIPTELGEVTWAMYKRVNRAYKDFGVLDDILFISALTGMSNEDWRDFDNVPEYLRMMTQIYPLYGEMISYQGGKRSDSIPDLLWKNTGQYQDCAKIAKNLHAVVVEYGDNTPTEAFEEAYERFYKIYHQPIQTGEEYSPEAAMKMDIQNKPFKDVVDFASFFFRSWIELHFGITVSASTSKKPRKNLWRRLMRSA